MRAVLLLVCLLSCLWGRGGANAAEPEPSTNRMELLILPEAGASLIEQSTNLISVQVLNLYDFSSIRVQSRILPLGNRLPFWDSIQPSQPLFDGIFQANHSVPDLDRDGELLIEFSISADDISDFGSVPRPLLTNFIHRLVILTRPGNDDFANAFPIPARDGSISNDTRFATMEAGEPAPYGSEADGSIWYAFRPPSRGVLTLTALTNSAGMPRLSLFAGSALTNLVMLQTFSGVESESAVAGIVQPVMEGTTYHLAVYGRSDEPGAVGFKHEFLSKNGWYYLALESDPGGTPSRTSSFYQEDSVVSLAALTEVDFEFAGWEGDVVSMGNPIGFRLNKDMRLRARFHPTTYADDFESRNLKKLAWNFGGTSSWFIQSAIVSSGTAALRSGPIADNQWSSASVVLTNRAGRGLFDYRTSSEEGWDFLEFRLNDQILGTWSGQSGWKTFHFDVPAGVNTFTWRYSKDSNFSTETDAAFVDNIYLPMNKVSGPSPARLGLFAMPDGERLVHLSGDWHQVYTLQYSPNLLHWSDSLTSASTNGVIFLSIPSSNRSSAGYYRALIR